MIILLALLFSIGWSAFAQNVTLSPADAASLGSWAKVIQAVRLYPTPQSAVKYEGPQLSLRLWGEVMLGKALYPFLLGVTPENDVGLWLDKNRDGRITAEEQLPADILSSAVLWAVSLISEPTGSLSFSYPIQILWPEGRSYVFLVGGAPRAGIFAGRTIVLVDGDLNGAFGSAGDFLGVDVDGDGRIYAEPDGHERFKITEAFTIESQSFRVKDLSFDGTSLTLEPTDYVPPKAPLIPGAPAPDFSFRNFLDGKELKLSQFRGKVVLLDFWATWCPPCMASLPELLKIYQEFHPRGFEIIGVSLDESVEDLRKVLESYRISWPVAFFAKRWENPVADLYRVYQIPTAYLLDKNGIIRFRDLDGEELRRAIEELLADPYGEAAEAPPFFTLTLSSPPRVTISPKSTAQFFVELFNQGRSSLKEVTIVWEDLPPGVNAEPVPPFSLEAGEERKVFLSLSAQDLDPQFFPAFATLAIFYRVGESSPLETKKTRIELVLEGVADEAQAPFPWWLLGLFALSAIFIFFLLKQ